MLSLAGDSHQGRPRNAGTTVCWSSIKNKIIQFSHLTTDTGTKLSRNPINNSRSGKTDGATEGRTLAYRPDFALLCDKYTPFDRTVARHGRCATVEASPTVNETRYGCYRSPRRGRAPCGSYRMVTSYYTCWFLGFAVTRRRQTSCGVRRRRCCLSSGRTGQSSGTRPGEGST